MSEQGASVRFEDSVTDATGRHAVHAIIWARSNKTVEKHKYEAKAVIMMQMRSDGYIGFPGGMVDETIHQLSIHESKERVTEAINRECIEEINLDTTAYRFSNDNYMFTDSCRDTILYCHFYSLEVTLDQFIEIESAASKAIHFGDEVMGIFRPPLFTMVDGMKGFPAFLSNAFIGNSREQLLKSLLLLELFTENEIKDLKTKSMLCLGLRSQKLAFTDCGESCPLKPV